MMSDENANKANYYANMFAGPKQDYAFDRQQDTASAQQAYKEKNMATKQGYDLQQMQYKTQLTEHLREIEGKIKMAEQSHEYGLKAQLQAQAGQIKAALANINGRWGVAKAQVSGKGGGSKSSSGSSSGDNLNSKEVVSVITKLIAENHSPSYIYTYLMDSPGVNMNDNEFQYYWNLPSVQQYFHAVQGADADPSYSYIDSGNENG